MLPWPAQRTWSKMRGRSAEKGGPARRGGRRGSLTGPRQVRWSPGVLARDIAKPRKGERPTGAPPPHEPPNEAPSADGGQAVGSKLDAAFKAAKRSIAASSRLAAKPLPNAETVAAGHGAAPSSAPQSGLADLSPSSALGLQSKFSDSDVARVLEAAKRLRQDGELDFEPVEAPASAQDGAEAGWGITSSGATSRLNRYTKAHFRRLDHSHTAADTAQGSVVEAKDFTNPLTSPGRVTVGKLPPALRPRPEDRGAAPAPPAPRGPPAEHSSAAILRAARYRAAAAHRAAQRDHEDASALASRTREQFAAQDASQQPQRPPPEQATPSPAGLGDEGSEQGPTAPPPSVLEGEPPGSEAPLSRSMRERPMPHWAAPTGDRTRPTSAGSEPLRADGARYGHAEEVDTFPAGVLDDSARFISADPARWTVGTGPEHAGAEAPRPTPETAPDPYLGALSGAAHGVEPPPEWQVPSHSAHVASDASASSTLSATSGPAAPIPATTAAAAEPVTVAGPPPRERAPPAATARPAAPATAPTSAGPGDAAAGLASRGRHRGYIPPSVADASRRVRGAEFDQSYARRQSQARPLPSAPAPVPAPVPGHAFRAGAVPPVRCAAPPTRGDAAPTALPVSGSGAAGGAILALPTGLASSQRDGDDRSDAGAGSLGTSSVADLSVTEQSFVRRALDARLGDLCSEDKAKVARLVQQLVRVGKEHERAVSELEEQRSAYEDRLSRMRGQNKRIVGEATTMKQKLEHSMSLLRTYQSRLLHLKERELTLSVRLKKESEHVQELEQGRTQLLRSPSPEPRSLREAVAQTESSDLEPQESAATTELVPSPAVEAAAASSDVVPPAAGDGLEPAAAATGEDSAASDSANSAPAASAVEPTAAPTGPAPSSESAQDGPARKPEVTPAAPSQEEPAPEGDGGSAVVVATPATSAAPPPWDEQLPILAHLQGAVEALQREVRALRRRQQGEKNESDAPAPTEESAGAGAADEGAAPTPASEPAPAAATAGEGVSAEAAGQGEAPVDASADASSGDRAEQPQEEAASAPQRPDAASEDEGDQVSRWSAIQSSTWGGTCENSPARPSSPADDAEAPQAPAGAPPSPPPSAAEQEASPTGGPTAPRTECAPAVEEAPAGEDSTHDLSHLQPSAPAPTPAPSVIDDSDEPRRVTARSLRLPFLAWGDLNLLPGPVRPLGPVDVRANEASFENSTLLDIVDQLDTPAAEQSDATVGDILEPLRQEEGIWPGAEGEDVVPAPRRRAARGRKAAAGATKAAVDVPGARTASAAAGASQPPPRHTAPRGASRPRGRGTSAAGKRKVKRGRAPQTQRRATRAPPPSPSQPAKWVLEEDDATGTDEQGQIAPKAEAEDVEEGLGDALSDALQEGDQQPEEEAGVQQHQHSPLAGRGEGKAGVRFASLQGRALPPRAAAPKKEPPRLGVRDAESIFHTLRGLI